MNAYAMNIFRKFFKYSFLGLFLVLYNCTYYLFETEQVLLIRWNPLLHHSQSQIITKPGLHIRIPFVDQFVLWDSRIQHTVLRSNTFLLDENSPIYVEYAITWKIVDLQKFLTQTKDLKLFKTNVVHILAQQLQRELELTWQMKSLKEFIQTPPSIAKDRFIKSALKKGIEIISVDFSQIIPGVPLRKKIMTHMEQKQLQQAEKIIEAAQKKADNILTTSRYNDAIEREKIRVKTQEILMQGERTAYGIYRNAYQHHFEFAEVFHTLTNYKRLCADKTPEVLKLSLKSPPTPEKTVKKKRSFFGLT